MKFIKMTLRQSQFILDAFRAITTAPFICVPKPMLILDQDTLKIFLQNIRDTKAALFAEYPQVTAAIFAELCTKEVSVPFTGQQLADTIAVLEAVIGEANGNPAHIRALVGKIEDIRLLRDRLLDENHVG